MLIWLWIIVLMILQLSHHFLGRVTKLNKQGIETGQKEFSVVLGMSKIFPGLGLVIDDINDEIQIRYDAIYCIVAFENYLATGFVILQTAEKQVLHYNTRTPTLVKTTKLSVRKCCTITSYIHFERNYLFQLTILHINAA